MFFDKVVFKRKSVDFRFRYNVIEIGDIAHHSRNLLGLFRGVKILLYSVF